MAERKKPAGRSSGTGARGSRPRRSWRVLPALEFGEGGLEGTRVLEDFPGALGFVLWLACDQVRLWASAPADARWALFAPQAAQRFQAEVRAAAADDRLAEPLGVVLALLRDPASTTAEALAQACLEISSWADERGKLGTALELARVAAAAAPADAAAAFAVGRLARRQAQYQEAESWYRRGVALARRSGDRYTYARCLLGLGVLAGQRGNFPAARQHHLRCLKAARRYGVRDVEAKALHELFLLHVDAERPEEAQRYAEGAFRAYGPGHPRLFALAHDVAYFWMTQGRFELALPVFQAVLPHAQAPADRLCALANVARSAGAIGARVEFEDAWAAAWSLSREAELQDNVPGAMLDMARGAASLKEWGRAELAAGRALEVAAARGEARIGITAESLLDWIRTRNAPAAVAEPRAELSEEAPSRLAHSLVQSLRGEEVSTRDAPSSSWSR